MQTMTEQFRKWLFLNLPRLVKKFGTPFHVYDLIGIFETGRAMIHAFRRVGYRQYFAVKALPNPFILQFLYEELGFGFDCSSIAELRLVRAIGARGEDIIFTSNNTTVEEFKEALAHGGCILNLDDISLIKKVPGKFPEFICFRYNPGKRRTGNSIIGEPKHAKYGITYAQILPAYREAKRRGTKRFGLHTMVCSNELRAKYMVETVRMLLEIAALLKKELGIELEFINMGGGWGIPYKPGQKKISLTFMADRITKLLEEFGKKHGFTPKLLSECGRYPTGPHGVMVVKVINQKFIYERHVGVDAAMNGLMRHGIYNAYHHADVLTSRGVPRRGRRARMNLVGAICENCDRLATNRLLPKATKEGDLVVVHCTGAHGWAMCFQYNGRLRIQELARYPDETVRRIRRAERVEDLFPTLRFKPKKLRTGRSRRLETYRISRLLEPLIG